jgi:hypothetical protein
LCNHLPLNRTLRCRRLNLRSVRFWLAHGRNLGPHLCQYRLEPHRIIRVCFDQHFLVRVEFAAAEVDVLPVHFLAELYALGIRNAMGLYIHPDTGELWETENGPQGGDEINIIRAEKNYGWPVISYGRAYTGELTGGTGPTLDRP